VVVLRLNSEFNLICVGNLICVEALKKFAQLVSPSSLTHTVIMF